LSEIHHPVLALTVPSAAEIDAGTEILLKVKLSCPAGCDLRGHVIDIVAPGGPVVASCGVERLTDGVHETTLFGFAAPEEVGEHSWSLVLRRHEAEGVIHEAASLPIAVRTRPHETSLAVWGVPSPVVVGQPLRVHVGATCSAGCDLTGKDVQVCDEAGGAVARATLGATPWDGTRALYWTEVDLAAPARAGATSRSVTFVPQELRLPHDGASTRFGFETVMPPQHAVTVKVSDKEAGTPIEGAQIRLGVYFAYSDPKGLARVAVPEGTYSLDVFKTGYEAQPQVVEVARDVIVDVDVVTIPPENPDAYWLFDPARRV
jgi:hypothetical protein